MYQPASSATYYFHHNAHGDVVALTDSTAKVVATYNYDPWGKITNEWYAGSTIKNPFRYGGAYGYYYDSETGMYYLRARYYKPDIYRFISKDPVQGDPRDPMSLNLYAYCASNPVNAVDPTGLVKWNLFADGLTDIIFGAIGMSTAIAAVGSPIGIIGAIWWLPASSGAWCQYLTESKKCYTQLI